eukprot:COSAG02_NODE_3099_length_7378_cov_3.046984_9_plen_65_part_00
MSAFIRFISRSGTQAFSLSVRCVKLVHVDGDGMSYHAFMRKHLKQHGGNMAKAAQAYLEMKGGH